MEDRAIGGRVVSPIGLGGAQWSLTAHPDDERSIRCIRDALDAGVTLLDTAHAYTTLGEVTHSESIVRRALAGHPDRDKVLIATKGGHWRAGPSSFPIDGRPERLRSHLEASLRALEVERIGLYQLHHPDPAVPVEESVGALAEFQREGKIDLIGVSNFSRDLLDRAAAVARIDSVQNEFSPFRSQDASLIPDLAGQGIAYLAYSPLGGGARVGSLGDALPGAAGLARDRGVSIPAIVLAWMLTRFESVVPIVGARHSATMLDALSALEVRLAPPEVSLIDAEVRALADGPSEDDRLTTSTSSSAATAAGERTSVD